MNTSRFVILVALLIGLVVGVKVWVAGHGGDWGTSGRGQSYVGEGPDLDSTTAQGGDQTSAFLDQSAPVNPRDDRKPLLASSRVWHVRDRDGVGIAAVKVTWRVEQSHPVGWQPSWEHGGLILSGVAPLGGEATDSLGAYTTQELGTNLDGRDLVVWFMKEGWLSHGMRLDPKLPRSEWPLDVVLEPAPGLTTLVVDSGGSPVAGVEVTTSGLYDPSSSFQNSADAELLPYALQSAVTDANGLAYFATLPGDVLVEAHAGDQAAVSYRGQCRELIRLQLRDSFEVSGRLLLPPDSLERTQSRLRLSVRRSGEWTDLHTGVLGAGEEWMPFRVPMLSDAVEYELIVEGSPFLAERRYFSPPPVNDSLFFDIQLQPGESLWFCPVEAETLNDPDPKVIPGGRVRLLVMQDGQWLETWFGAAPDGVIYLEGVYPGFVQFQIFAAGFAPTPVKTVTVPLDEDFIWLEGLEASGTLRGKVLEVDGASERPAADFQITVWDLANPRNKSTFPFVGRVDGSFEIGTVQTGEIAVTATTPSRPAGLPLGVLLEPGASEELEIRIERGSSLTGRVLDATSGNPILNARVQLYVQGPSGPISPWGATHNVGANGAFEVAGGVPRENFVNVEAEGYSSQFRYGHPDDSGRVDFGDILLSPPASLIVGVTGLDESDDLDPESLSVRLTGANRLELPLEKGSNGDWQALFSVVNSGRVGVELIKDLRLFRSMSLDLAAGAQHVTEFDLVTGATISLTMVGGEGERRPSRGRYVVSAKDGVGEDFHYAVDANVGGPTIIRGVRGTTGTVLLSNYEGRVSLGASTFELVAGETTDVEVDLDARTFRVHLTDKAGQPLSSAYVQVSLAGTGVGVIGNYTDTNGDVDLFGVPKEIVLVTAQHSEAGRCFGVEADATKDVFELTLDGTGSLEVVAIDGSDPLAGIDVSLLVGTSIPLVTIPTGLDGAALFERLMPSRINLLINGIGLWEERSSLEIEEGDTRAQIQVWRTGSLVIDVASSSGGPLAGALLQLEHVGTGEALAGWLGAGRVSAGSDVSSTSGKFQVGPIPHGQYRWTVTHAGSHPSSGLIEVSHGETTTQPILLESRED